MTKTVFATIAVIALSMTIGCDSGTTSTTDSGRPGTDSGGGTDGGGVDGTTPRPDTGPIPPGFLCMDECGPDNSYVGDGDCDDGGEGSDTSVCEYGTDCTDCGARDPDGCTPSCADGAECGSDGCGGSCGECAAGSECSGSSCVVCGCDEIGCGMDACGTTDCGDCADSPGECYRAQCRTPDCAGRTCGRDGAGGNCGDMMGGCPDMQYCLDGSCGACSCAGRECGTTCGEACGDMMGACPGEEVCDNVTGQCLAAPDAACNDTCNSAADGECDDGRPGSHFSLCEAGTDCTDCGPVT